MASFVLRACWGLLAALLVALLWTAAVLLVVRADLGDARDHLEAAADSDEPAQATTLLRQAIDELRQADARLGQPGPRVAASLPVIGRTVDAVRDSTRAALVVAGSGEQLLAALPADLMPGGRVDVAALAEVGRAAERAAERTRGPVSRLGRVQLGLVPGVAADGVREAQDRLLGAPDAFERTARAISGLTALLGSDRPRPVLVMLQNNAELRGSGGVVTVFAQATAAGGRLQVGAFRDVQDVADTSDAARRVPAPADYRELWGPFLADSTLWLNVNMTPDVPTASNVLADVAVASGLPRPEAILWFDVRAIAALLEATGPVRLPGGTRLSAENAVRVLLSDAYADAQDTSEGQAARRAALRGAADAVLGELFAEGGPDASAPRLAGALAAAAGGRHLALWSADQQEQADLVQGGLGGEVTAGDGDLSSFAVQNFGGGNRQGNKLDYYARRQVTVRVEVGADEAVVEQEVSLRNTAPRGGLPTYVAGQVDPGTSRNYVSLAVPASASDVQLSREGQAVDVVAASSGDHRVLTDGLELPPGGEATWRLRYRLPVKNGRYDLALFPQPLAVDAGLLVEVTPGDDVKLSARDDTELSNGSVRISGAYDHVTRLSLSVERPGRLERWRSAVRRFWNEPVPLP